MDRVMTTKFFMYQGKLLEEVFRFSTRLFLLSNFLTQDSPWNVSLYFNLKKNCIKQNHLTFK